MKAAKNREMKQVSTEAAQSADEPNPLRFVEDYAALPSTVLTCATSDCVALPHKPAAMKRLASKYAPVQAQFDCVESFWSMLKRSCSGTLQRILPENVQHYVKNRTGQHTAHESDPAEQMSGSADDIRGEGLLSKDLVRGKWRSAGATATAQLAILGNGAGLASTLAS